MRTLTLGVLLALVVGFRAEAQLQTCLPGGTSPTTAPRPTGGSVYIPPVDGGAITLADGGTFRCAFTATVPGGAAPQLYGSTLAKCNTITDMLMQAAANDNGWNDGGTP